MVMLCMVNFALSASAAAWQAGVDLRCIDSSFYPALRLDVEASYRFRHIRVTLPIRYSHSYDYDLDFLETGLAVSVYPFDGFGFYAGVSLLRLGVFWGIEAPDDNLLFFSEAMIGWTIEFPYFYLEPRISFTDVFSSEESRLAELREAVPQYSRFRVSLIAGFTI